MEYCSSPDYYSSSIEEKEEENLNEKKFEKIIEKMDILFPRDSLIDINIKRVVDVWKNEIVTDDKMLKMWNNNQEIKEQNTRTKLFPSLLRTITANEEKFVALINDTYFMQDFSKVFDLKLLLNLVLDFDFLDHYISEVCANTRRFGLRLDIIARILVFLSPDKSNNNLWAKIIMFCISRTSYLQKDNKLTNTGDRNLYILSKNFWRRIIKFLPYHEFYSLIEITPNFNFSQSVLVNNHDLAKLLIILNRKVRHLSINDINEKFINEFGDGEFDTGFYHLLIESLSAKAHLRNRKISEILIMYGYSSDYGFICMKKFHNPDFDLSTISYKNLTKKDINSKKRSRVNTFYYPLDNFKRRRIE
jgi:hypothetical protein